MKNNILTFDTFIITSIFSIITAASVVVLNRMIS